MNGKLIGIGVGPGDPELISLKAINILKEIDVVICPEAREGKGSFAFEISKPYIGESAEILNLTFPMVYDRDQLTESWKSNADKIEEVVNSGKSVAFVTLGDPAVYSTYMYIVPMMIERGVTVETIPGITSFCSVAATANIPLTTWEETLGIVPLQKDLTTAKKALDEFDNVVIMKPSHGSRELAHELVERGLEDKFVMISKVSTGEQNIITDIEVLKNEKVPYLSTMIVKRKGF